MSAAPREFDHYTFVLLRRPSDAPDLPEAELDRLQEEHLRYLASLGSEGCWPRGPSVTKRTSRFAGCASFAGRSTMCAS